MDLDKKVKPPVNYKENTNAIAKYRSNWEEHGFLPVCIKCTYCSHLEQMDP